MISSTDQALTVPAAALDATIAASIAVCVHWLLQKVLSTCAAAVAQGGKSASGGLVPAFTVHHELGMQHQIATGLLHLCSVAGAAAQQTGIA